MSVRRSLEQSTIRLVSVMRDIDEILLAHTSHSRVEMQWRHSTVCSFALTLSSNDDHRRLRQRE